MRVDLEEVPQATGPAIYLLGISQRKQLLCLGLFLGLLDFHSSSPSAALCRPNAFTSGTPHIPCMTNCK